jgi:hypothetical protein
MVKIVERPMGSNASLAISIVATTVLLLNPPASLRPVLPIPSVHWPRLPLFPPSVCFVRSSLRRVEVLCLPIEARSQQATADDSKPVPNATTPDRGLAFRAVGVNRTEQ